MTPEERGKAFDATHGKMIDTLCAQIPEADRHAVRLSLERGVKLIRLLAVHQDELSHSLTAVEVMPTYDDATTNIRFMILVGPPHETKNRDFHIALSVEVPSKEED